MSAAVKSWPERRQSHRVEMESPIRFEWLTDEGDVNSTRGATRDVSAGGVYCYIEKSVDIGLQVEFDVLFQLAQLAGKALMFRCQGRVIRVEEYGARFGVVVSIQSRHIIPSEEHHPRAHWRVVPSWPVVAEYEGLQALVRDLSPLGAFIETDDPLPVGREIELNLQGQELRGEVNARAISRRVDYGAGMGIEFVFLAADGDRRLREFLDRSTARKC